MTDAELRALLIDCLALWGAAGRVEIGGAELVILAADARFGLRRATPDQHPVRWLLTIPAWQEAGRGPRAALSIAAVLTALRSAIGEYGDRLPPI
ncbi:MAG TPA: hypothetical protein VLI93_14190 [Acetobacteraceae bacterium]|nr:hypothetical protein [Acetobacteraceae bacterium]